MSGDRHSNRSADPEVVPPAASHPSLDAGDTRRSADLALELTPLHQRSLLALDSVRQVYLDTIELAGCWPGHDHTALDRQRLRGEVDVSPSERAQLTPPAFPCPWRGWFLACPLPTILGTFWDARNTRLTRRIRTTPLDSEPRHTRVPRNSRSSWRSCSVSRDRAVACGMGSR